MKPTDFAKALSHYLAIFLPDQRNVSANTMIVKVPVRTNGP